MEMLPKCDCEEPDFECTPVPTSYVEIAGNFEPVYDGPLKKTNISCLKCHRQWLRTEDNGLIVFREHNNTDAVKFIATVHEKDMKKSGDDYIPEHIDSKDFEAHEAALKEKEDAWLRNVAFDTLKPHEKDLAQLVTVYKTGVISPDEIRIILEHKYPELNRNELLTDIEQWLDPQFRRYDGDYSFYFARGKRK